MMIILQSSMGSQMICRRNIHLICVQHQIFKSWFKVGFVPFIHYALDHRMVSHMLVEGGVSEERALNLKSTQKSYDDFKKGEK